MIIIDAIRAIKEYLSCIDLYDILDELDIPVKDD